MTSKLSQAQEAMRRRHRSQSPTNPIPQPIPLRIGQEIDSYIVIKIEEFKARGHYPIHLRCIHCDRDKRVEYFELLKTDDSMAPSVINPCRCIGGERRRRNEHMDKVLSSMGVHGFRPNPSDFKKCLELAKERETKLKFLEEVCQNQRKKRLS